MVTNGMNIEGIEMNEETVEKARRTFDSRAAASAPGGDKNWNLLLHRSTGVAAQWPLRESWSRTLKKKHSLRIATASTQIAHASFAFFLISTEFIRFQRLVQENSVPVFNEKLRMIFTRNLSILQM